MIKPISINIFSFHANQISSKRKFILANMVLAPQYYYC